MKFKKLKEPVYTSDLYYDFFEGGYLEPKDFLSNAADVKKVEAAKKIVKEYLHLLESKNLIELE